MQADLRYPGLAMARSIGDCEMDAYGVIPDPDITEYDDDDGGNPSSPRGRPRGEGLLGG